MSEGGEEQPIQEINTTKEDSFENNSASNMQQTKKSASENENLTNSNFEAVSFEDDFENQHSNDNESSNSSLAPEEMIDGRRQPSPQSPPQAISPSIDMDADGNITKPQKSRPQSLVSFKLPPNSNGEPLLASLDRFQSSVNEPAHGISPVISPHNEVEFHSNKPLTRSSFEAIPFGETPPNEQKEIELDSEEQHLLDEIDKMIPTRESVKTLKDEHEEYIPSKEPLNVFHSITPLNITSPSISPDLIAPENLPSEPEELKGTARSTFEAIEFSESDGEETIHIGGGERPKHNRTGSHSNDKSNDSTPESLNSQRSTSSINSISNSNYRNSNSSHSQRSKSQNNRTNQNQNQIRPKPKPTRPKITKLPLDQLNTPDSETQEEIREFKRTGRLPDTTRQPKLVKKIQSARTTAVINGDYDKAGEMNELAKKLQTAIVRGAGKEYRTELMQQAQEKLDEAKKEYDKVHSTWSERLSDAETKNKERKDTLTEEHLSQIAAFEEKWNDEDFLRRYTKPSPKLLQLKAMERSMVIAKLFDRAKIARKSAEVLEKAETEEAQKRASKEMELQRAHLVDRQAREMGVLEIKCSQLLDQLVRQRDLEERPYLKRISKLENEISALKNEPESFNPNTVFIQTGTGGNIHERELPSVRTTQLLLVSRKDIAPNPKLSIKPLGNVSDKTRKLRTIRVRASTTLK